MLATLFGAFMRMGAATQIVTIRMVPIFTLGISACVPSLRSTADPGSRDVLEVDVLTASDTSTGIAYVRAAFDGTPTTVTLQRLSSGRYGAPIK